MTVAELFVQIGVKGGKESKNALGGVKDGLGEVKKMSLEAKAAIIGAIYALERMMSSSSQAGTGFMNFTSLTGMSAQSLQQWQYAARQAGVSAEEMQGSMQGVQQKMSDMLMGKGAPEGMAMLANTVGFDPAQARNTEYVLKQLQEFAKTVPADIGNSMMRSFGVSDGVIAAMRRNSFKDDVFAKAPKYSDSTIAQLNKVDVATSNLKNKVEMAFGAFTSKHGLGIVSDISKLVTQVLRLADAFSTVAEKLRLLEVVGKVFEGWGMIFDQVGAGVNAMMGQDPKSIKKLDKDPVTMARDWVGNQIAPKVSPSVNNSHANTVNANVVVNNHGVKDAHDSAKHMRKELNNTLRQIPTAKQGN